MSVSSVGSSSSSVSFCQRSLGNDWGRRGRAWSLGDDRLVTDTGVLAEEGAEGKQLNNFGESSLLELFSGACSEFRNMIPRWQHYWTTLISDHNLGINLFTTGPFVPQLDQAFRVP